MSLYSDKWGTVPEQIVCRQFWLNHVTVEVECASHLWREPSKLNVFIATDQYKAMGYEGKYYTDNY